MGAVGKGRCSVAWRWTGARLVIAAVLLGVASGVLCGSGEAAAPALEWPAGALDPGFASGGVLIAPFANPPGPQEGRDAVIQPDGKIVVLTTSAYTSYLSRYLPDGESDATFGNGGSVALPSPGHNRYSALTLDAQGRMVVIGMEPTTPWQAPDKSLQLNNRSFNGVVYRFLPDGSPDSSFGTDGKTVIAVPPPEGLTPGSAATYPSAVLATSDGSITVGGGVSSVCYWEVGFEFAQFWEESGTFVARLGPDGSLESQFGSSGLVSTHARCKHESGSASEGFGGLAQPSPETVLALSDHPEDNTWRFRTYSPTGALSEVQAPAEGQSPMQVAVLPDHNLLVGVYGTELLRQFTSQGTPDTAFGTNGSVDIPSMWCVSTGCFSVVPDGRIVVAGIIVAPYPRVGIRRYLADGSPDDSFGAPPWLGGGGYALTQLTPEAGEVFVNKLLISDGKPLVIGGAIVHRSGSPYPQTALALFQADGGFSSNPPPPNPGEGPFSPIPPPPGEGSGGSGPGTSAGAFHGPVPGGRNSASVVGHGIQTGAVTTPVDASLDGVLNPSLRTISGLLKTGAFSLSFNAPEPGTLTVKWMSTSVRASRHRDKGRPIIVASGAKTFNAAGRGVVTLHLTAVGRRLLKENKTLRAIQVATFRPGKGAAVTRREEMTIRTGSPGSRR